MLEQIVNYIGSVGLKHKAVKTFKYQKRSLINQQNNNGYVELIIEDNAYLQQVITQNIFTATFNVDILGFPKDDTEILGIQSLCMQIAVEIMAYIERDGTFLGKLSIHDYDILLVSHFTDDSSCGVRLSLELVMPNPLNLCSYLDNFDENVEIAEKPTLNLTQADKAVPTNKKKELNLRPIKLKTK